MNYGRARPLPRARKCRKVGETDRDPVWLLDLPHLLLERWKQHDYGTSRGTQLVPGPDRSRGRCAS